jgi:hypothetical protein
MKHTRDQVVERGWNYSMKDLRAATWKRYNQTRADPPQTPDPEPARRSADHFHTVLLHPTRVTLERDDHPNAMRVGPHPVGLPISAAAADVKVDDVARAAKEFAEGRS